MQSCIRFRPKEDPERALKRVSMSIEEYFYGLVESKKRYNDKKIKRHYKCNECKKVLYSNLRFMSHVKHKILKSMTNNNAKKNSQATCTQCYRKFKTKYIMQTHIVRVHEEDTSHLICGICELHFKNENLYLAHMKDIHCFKDTPYACKVCDFRTSYYHEMATHYKNMHLDNSKFLCCFCLDTFTSPTVFLNHNMDHVKRVNPCPKCCLQFVDKIQLNRHLHKEHTTHPSLLKGMNFSDYEICVFDKGENQSAEAEQDDLTFEDIQMIEEYLESSVSFNIKEINIPKKLQKNSHVCYGCKKNVGSTSDELKAHFGQQFICNECPFESFCEYEYKHHVTMNHKSKSPIKKKRPQKGKRSKPLISSSLAKNPHVKEEILSSDDDVAVVGAYLEKEFSCPHCAYITSKKEEYDQHVTKHTDIDKNKLKGRKRKISNDTSFDDILPMLDSVPGTSGLSANKNKTPATPSGAKRLKGKVTIESQVANGISGNDAKNSMPGSSYQMQYVDTNKSCQVSTKYLLLNNSQIKQMVMAPVGHNNDVTGFKRPLQRKDTPKPPINLHILERKQTSIMLAWNHPLNCSVTQYRVTFKGAAQPTTQYLPPHQTIVRLVGLRQNIEYMIRVYSVYKNDLSLHNEISCRTLKRDNVLASSDVIVIEDDKNGKAKTKSKTTSTNQMVKHTNGPKRIVVNAESLLNMNGGSGVKNTLPGTTFVNTQPHNSTILLGPLSSQNLASHVNAANRFLPNVKSATPFNLGKTIPFKIIPNHPTTFIIQGNQITQAPIPFANQNQSPNLKVAVGNPISVTVKRPRIPTNIKAKKDGNQKATRLNVSTEPIKTTVVKKPKINIPEDPNVFNTGTVQESHPDKKTLLATETEILPNPTVDTSEVLKEFTLEQDTLSKDKDVEKHFSQITTNEIDDGKSVGMPEVVSESIKGNNLIITSAIVHNDASEQPKQTPVLALSKDKDAEKHFSQITTNEIDDGNSVEMPEVVSESIKGNNNLIITSAIVHTDASEQPKQTLNVISTDVSTRPIENNQHLESFTTDVTTPVLFHSDNIAEEIVISNE